MSSLLRLITPTLLMLLLRWNLSHGFASTSIISSSSSSPSLSSSPFPLHPSTSIGLNQLQHRCGEYNNIRACTPGIASIRSCSNCYWMGQIMRSSALSASAPGREDDMVSTSTSKVAPNIISLPKLSFRVGIIGSGSIAYGTASLLASLGHDPMIWSPSGASAPKSQNGMTTSSSTIDDCAKTTMTTTIPVTPEAVAKMQSTGAIEHNFNVRVANSPDEIVRCNDDVLIVALPANGHRGVMDTLSPVIIDHLLARYTEVVASDEEQNEQHSNPSDGRSLPMHIIISSHASLGAVYFLQALREECHRRRRDVVSTLLNDDDILAGVRITSWGTTAVTARKTTANSVRVLTVRKSVDYCTVPTTTSTASSDVDPNTTSTPTTASTSISTPTRNELLLRNDGCELCTTLFGSRFTYRKGGLLAISLSNLNPQNHLGIVLGNMSRMDPPPPPPPIPATFASSVKEQSMSAPPDTSLSSQTSTFPSWYQGQNITPNIGRLMEALDKERIEIAKALGIDVRTIHEHFSWSFHVPMETPVDDDDDDDHDVTVDEQDTNNETNHSSSSSSSSLGGVAVPKAKMRPLTVSEMNQQMHHYLKNDVYGPTTPNSRYVLEDVPYGIVLTILLGKLVNKPAVLHDSGIRILSAMYGRNFMEENELLDGLGLLLPDSDEIDNLHHHSHHQVIPSLDQWNEMASTGTFSRQ